MRTANAALQSVASHLLRSARVVLWLTGVFALFGLAATSLPSPVCAQEEKQLVLFCWPGYVPESVIKAFTDETGIHVLVEYYNSNEELLRHRIAGRRYDLVQPSDYAAEVLINRGALEPLRLDRLTNLKNIGAEFRNLPHDPDGKYCVPWLAGTVGIVVNTDRIRDPIESLGDVFSGKYRGRIVALNDPREWLSWALCHLDLPVNEVTSSTLLEVKEVWEDWMPQVKVFDSDNAAKVMLSGQADIALTWSGDAASLLSASKAYQFVLPKEGAHQYVDCLAIAKGARHRDAAEEFLNFILRPDISLMISAAIPFTNPNEVAFEQLPEEARKNPASYPPGNPNLKVHRSIGEMAEEVDKIYYELRYGPINIKNSTKANLRASAGK